jgi:hypothetical protein
VLPKLAGCENRHGWFTQRRMVGAIASSTGAARHDTRQSATRLVLVGTETAD